MTATGASTASRSLPELSARIRRGLRCRIEKLWLRCLRRIYGFDAWHAAAPFSCRPYKGRLVELINSLRPRTVVEVGCGLGDILVRIDAHERFGFDIDAGVIRAVRALHPRAARWIQGDTGAVVRALTTEQHIDCLIMVNWTHNLSPQELSACVLPLLPRIRYLVVDAVDADGPASYRFKHDFAFMAPYAERRSTLRVGGEPRSFIVFEART